MMQGFGCKVIGTELGIGFVVWIGISCKTIGTCGGGKFSRPISRIVCPLSLSLAWLMFLHAKLETLSAFLSVLSIKYCFTSIETWQIMMASTKMAIAVIVTLDCLKTTTSSVSCRKYK
jgi:hypothetical protein